ncbi:MAG: TIGR03943 family protein [Candidatus Omnitrophota bacterium]
MGVFYKKLFKRGTAEMPRAAKQSRKWPFGWALFLLTVIAIIEFGNYFPINAAPKNQWQPKPRMPGMCPLRTNAAPIPPAPTLQNLEKIQPIATIPKKNLETQSARNTQKPDAKKVASGAMLAEKKNIPVQTSPEIIPKAKPAESPAKLGRMKAVINEDGSVEMQKEEPDMIRYETAGFLELNDDMYNRLDFYEGKKVEITGYVYRRSDFKPNQFVVARSYMWCCSFDASPVGPLCEWDRAPELTNDTWVKVEGLITREHFIDAYYEETGDIPIIKVEKIERVSKPENPYVYARNPAALFGSNRRSK